VGLAEQFSMRGVLIVIALFVVILIGRVSFLQFVKGQQFFSEAEGNRIHTDVISAVRGVVYDRDGNALVKNVPDFRLQLTARDVPHMNADQYAELFSKMSTITGVETGVIEEAFDHSFTSGQPTTLRTDIPYEEALQLMIRARDVSGLTVETFYKRDYLAGEAFGHVMGYTGKLTDTEYATLKNSGYLLNDNLGKAGVEKSYESTLRGTNGYRNIEVDYRGDEKAIVADVASEAGDNVRLSIDSDLQNSLYTAIKNIVDTRQLPGGSAVAIDPRNGHILALVSYPSYDSNAFVGGIGQDEYQALLNDTRQPLFHRAISGTYPSGSVFKPIVAAAALEEGVVTSQTTVMSSGGISIEGGFFFPDWKAGGHGLTNVIKALAESVNTYFYLAGGGDNENTSGLGVERITDYGRKFGLGKPTGVDLPGEAAGFLPSKAWKEEFKNEPWYLGDTYHLAIGQGDLLVTPIQVATYTAAFANGGTLYEPSVVESITDHEGAVVSTPEPLVANEQVVSDRSISLVLQGMREAVLNGTARSLQSLPVSSAGKTGTAQFGNGEKTHSWFTAFAPYDNPEIAVTVLVEEAGEGNDAALPVAKQALQDYFSNVNTEE
jgi:penicillin-binding protein 2